MGEVGEPRPTICDGGLDFFLIAHALTDATKSTMGGPLHNALLHTTAAERR